MEEEVEVEFDEIAEAHPMWAEIVGADVCVLPAAFPQAPPPGEGMVGWRAEVQAKRGSAAKANEQVRLFGAWFKLGDTNRILPVEQPPEMSSEDESDAGESDAGESHAGESDAGSQADDSSDDELADGLGGDAVENLD